MNNGPFIPLKGSSAEVLHWGGKYTNLHVRTDYNTLFELAISVDWHIRLPHSRIYNYVASNVCVYMYFISMSQIPLDSQSGTGKIPQKVLPFEHSTRSRFSAPSASQTVGSAIAPPNPSTIKVIPHPPQSNSDFSSFLLFSPS